MVTLNGQRVRGISPVWEEKVCGGKDLPKSQVLSSEWKTERVRKDESGDMSALKIFSGIAISPVLSNVLYVVVITEIKLK